MCVYAGSSLAECTTPSAPPSRLPALHCRTVEVMRVGARTTGLCLVLAAAPGEVGRARARAEDEIKKVVRFGDSVQDVCSAIGAPSRVFYKSEDKMKIHSPNAHRKKAALKSDYFFNYFVFGLVSWVWPYGMGYVCCCGGNLTTIPTVIVYTIQVV